MLQFTFTDCACEHVGKNRAFAKNNALVEVKILEWKGVIAN